jgi:hypothetical protein
MDPGRMKSAPLAPMSRPQFAPFAAYLVAPLALLAFLLASAAPARAADLAIDGQVDLTRLLGQPITMSIDGTPGAQVIVLVNTTPGPSVIKGQQLPVGVGPNLAALDFGVMPPGGVLQASASIPFDELLSGVDVYLAALLVSGPGLAVSNGVVLHLQDRDVQLAGNALPGYPHVEFVRAFNSGRPIQVAVDTVRYPWAAGVPADVYVTAKRTRDQWLADNTLVDVAGGPRPLTFPGGPITDNLFELDAGTLSAAAGTGLGVGYDVVVDLDRNGLFDGSDLIDGFSDEAGLYVVHDTTQPGPLAVTEALYSGGTLLGQNLFYPADIANLGALPLVVVSHGNGHNYQWYDHIGLHLASYGFIVMSHQNNTGAGVEAASTTTLTNTDYLLSNLATIEGGALVGHVDTHRITWMGHSRGGEGVVRAYDRVFEGSYVPVNFTAADIRLISSMAPTDFLGGGGADPHGVSYHLWVGGADADVTGCANNNVAQSFHLHDRARERRLSTSLHGVGHGDFHNSTGSVATGPCLVGKPDTHRVLKGYLLPLVLHEIEGNVPAQDFLWRQWESFRPIGAPDLNPCVTVDLQYRGGSATGKFVIDDFQTNTDFGTSSSGAGVSGDVQIVAEARFDDENLGFTWDGTPLNGFTNGNGTDTTRGLVLEYDGSGPRTLAFDVAPPAQDARGFRYLSFRAAQAARHPFTTAELADATFTVELSDLDGHSSSLSAGAYGGGIEEPYQRINCGTGTGWANEFETIRLALDDFRRLGAQDGTALDLARLARVTFRFGPGFGSAAARLGLDDIELVKD